MLNEKYTAWMIREDGNAIPCVQHIYGCPDCVEESVYAAEWLYNNTLRDETKREAIRFISAYAMSLDPDGDLSGNLLEKIRNQPYITLTRDFIKEIGGRLVKIEEDLQMLNRSVCGKLNNEFLRARLGGMYNTEEGSRDIYFRISSKNYDWVEMVTKFVSGHKDRIGTVTVIYDEESTGKNGCLCDANGVKMDHIPAEYFIGC